MEISTFLMGVIALSVAVIAALQVEMVVCGVRLASGMDRLVGRLEQEIQPTLNRVNDASGNVSRVTSLAVAQMERVDQVSADLVERCDHLLAAGQDAVVEPLQRSVALLHGLRVALNALRDASDSKKRATTAESKGQVVEDQEALFIG